MERNDDAFVCDKLSYWGARLFLCAKNKDDIDGLERFRNMVLQDYTAWTVGSALVLTVAFSLIMIDPSSFATSKDNSLYALKAVYLLCLSLSCGNSVAAVAIGTFNYLYYAGIPPCLLDKAILKQSEVRGWRGPHHFAFGASQFLMIGTVVGVLMQYDYLLVIIPAATFIIFAYYIIGTLLARMKSEDAVGLVFHPLLQED